MCVVLEILACSPLVCWCLCVCVCVCVCVCELVWCKLGGGFLSWGGDADRFGCLVVRSMNSNLDSRGA